MLSVSVKSLFKHFILILMLALHSGAIAQQFPGSSSTNGFGLDNQVPEFLPVREAYMPSAWFDGEDLLIQWNIAPDYYLYRERTSFDGDDFQYNEAVFEEGQLKHDEFFDKMMEVYYVGTQMRLTQFAGSGMLRVEAQGCADAGLCYPPTDFWFSVDSTNGSADYHPEAPPSVSVPSVNAPGSGQANALAGDQSTSAASLPGFWLAILMAFAGGLILNLMPCVFPVLAIKALKISSAGDNLGQRWREAGAYTAGILFTVTLIAALLLALRASGAQIGWGFQLQSPGVVISLTALFFLIGLNFSGWFNVGGSWMGFGQNLTADGKPLQSFFTGVLAMVVASPCSAPFMAAALGYAVQQPAAVSLTVFASLGLGMAMPLILLYSIPGLAKALPKPGPWMDKLKQFLAFPMYLTSVWLIWVLIAQIGATGTALVLTSLCLLSMAIWIYQQGHSSSTRLIGTAVLASAMVLAWNASGEKTASSSVKTFKLAELDALTGGPQPVFVDVTADWCITCKFNESRVLYAQDIQEIMKQKQVIYVVADWTNDNPEITALLDRYQRVGIPLYLFFAAGQTQPKILPQLLSKEMMRNLLNQ